MIPKVLHIVYNLIHGGTEGQCARLALALARQRHSQRMAVFRREGFFLVPIERVCGPVYEVGIRRMATIETFRKLRDLKNRIKEWNIELVHCWDADAAIFGSIAASWAGIPYITSRRDLGQIYPEYKLWLMHRADRAARRVTVNAEVIRRSVEAAGVPAERIVTIPNLVDLPEFDRLAAQPLSQGTSLSAGRLLGLVSRLDREKDVGMAIRALQLLSDSYPDVHLVIAGDGIEKQALAGLAENLGLGGRVLFLGEVREIPALLRRMEVGLLTPASNEGLSNSILEYMAARLPVVATDCGGNGELVKEGETGYLVKSGDAADLANAIAKLMKDREMAARLGENGRRWVEERHGPDRVVGQWLGVYSSAMGAG